MKTNQLANKFYQSKALLIAGIVIVVLLIVLPLTVPRFLKPDVLTVSLIPGLDALPFYLGLDKPIFLENRLLLKINPFQQEVERDRAFLSGNADLILCDLPSAILISNQGGEGQIIRSVLRSNPIRPLYAIFSQTRPESNLINSQHERFNSMESKELAVPASLGSQYLTDLLLKDISAGNQKAIKTIMVDTNPEAFEMLKKGAVSMSILRMPFTALAELKGFSVINDDRKDLFGMSVLVISYSIIRNKPQVLKRFLYAFEQSILELNYRPDRYAYLLKEKGGLPDELKERFPMPIYEGPNVPVESEIERAEDWLLLKGLINKRLPYQNMVNLRFLPDPDRVSRAACCL